MAEKETKFKVHDGLFHAAFGSKEKAPGLLKSVLPAELVQQIDFASLTPKSTKFTGPHLEARHSDLLFTAQMGGREVMIYVLLEHQSTNEPFMMARLLLYLALTWEGYLRDKKSAKHLPPILPVVVHHSNSGWTAAMRFEELIDPRARELQALDPYIPKMQMLLEDLSRVSDEELQRRELEIFQMLALWALRDARNPKRFFRHIVAWGRLLNQLAQDPRERRSLSLFLEYIATVLGEDRRDELQTALLNVAPAAEEAMQSIAESWERQGIEKGRAQGERDLVIRLLKTRFQLEALPEQIQERLAAATLEDLERYADRILDATRLEEVFAED